MTKQEEDIHQAAPEDIMLPASRLRCGEFVVMSILMLMLLVIVLDTLHLIYWPVNARYVIAYPRLFLNRPWYIYGAAPPGIAYGMSPECVAPPELGGSWSAISTTSAIASGNGTTIRVRTVTNDPLTLGFTDHEALYGVVKQVPSMYPSVCPPVIFYIDATAWANQSDNEHPPPPAYPGAGVEAHRRSSSSSILNLGRLYSHYRR